MREPDESVNVGSLTMTAGPYPQFNAGRRLTNTSELMEMVLLELPTEDVLFAQRINRQFRSVHRRITSTPAPTFSRHRRLASSISSVCDPFYRHG